MVTIGSNRAMEIAAKLYDVLRTADPNSFVHGDPRKGHDTIIDGTFNLLDVAALLEKEFVEMPRRIDP
jgi:hypothetical protein